MNNDQLRIILNKLFDDGRNAEYRVNIRMITQGEAMKKQEKDVAEALEMLRKLLEQTNG